MAKPIPPTAEQLEKEDAKRQEEQERVKAAQEAAPPPVSEAEREELEETRKHNLLLEQESLLLKQQLAQMQKMMADLQARMDLVHEGRQQAQVKDTYAEGEEPVFDESQPHGVVWGDTQIAYVQDGHQFGRDRKYVQTEKFRGSPRPFNVRLVGMVKPRNPQTGDILDGFRDRVAA